MERISVIKNCTVITPFKMIKNGVAVFKDGRIITVGQEKDVETPKEAKVIDASGGIVAPGFIDIHIHGGKGSDVMDASYEAINKLARFEASHGTTAFLATTISAAHNDLLNAAKTVNVSMKKGTDGAEVLGVHLEGPYINPKKCGGQDSKYIRPPSVSEFREILKASNYTVRLVTLAPEVDGAKKLIVELRNFGITASIGHSNATYSEVVDAIKHGISHATHTFNRMRGFDHREPGVVGAVLIHDELTAELICDYVHVHPAAMKLLTKVKGSSGVVLVTDAIRAAGMPDGKYKLGKRNIIVKNGVSRLESGELAGSTLTMDKAVRNMVNLVGASLQEAVIMATINPAKVVGVDNRKGSLEQGKDADFVILDRDLNVCSTIVRGKMVHRKTIN
ncbi:N-acetylglucosamine-6-phosphate deacetylase, partial [Candidatus Bathyarchaeota archaeon]